MWGGIGTNLRIFFIAATLSCISQFSFGQFFIGGKKCISITPPTPPDPLPQGWQPPSVDCNEPTVFFDTEKDATAWQWDFGDPTSGNNTATTRNPRHTYTVPREYTVTLTRTLASGVVETVTKQVTISQPPPQPKFFKKISGDTTVCDGKTLKLDPYNVLQGGASAPSNATYLWFPGGETTPTIDVTKTGCYSVEVFDALGQCSRTAKINVKFCLQEASSSGGGEKWYFGKGATLSFGLDSTTILPRDTLANGGGLFEDPEQEDPRYIPVEATESNPVDSPAGVAMVYSPKGELVFYTDGVKIYGKDDQLLPFMLPLDDPDPTNQTLGGTNTSAQSSLIIPKSSCNECPHHLYYVYTQNKDTGLLSYSIVDLRRDNGKGAVVERGIPVSINSTQQIVARKTKDEKGFFIYSHDAETNEFKVLKVDSTGTTETIQALGLDEFSETGYMRISPEGDKLAMAIVKDGKNYIEVYDLNIENGELTLSLSIDLKVASPPSVYGVEFSQDGEKLYTTLKGNPANGEKSFLYQLNLNLGDPNAIADQKILIDESTTQVFGALQMGPTNAGSGGAIYMAIDGSDRVAYISVPEVVGNASAVGYVPVRFGFGADVTGTSQLGFPNVIHAKKEDEGEGISATFDGTCEGSPTVFKTQGICSPMKSEATWDFGDGTTGAGNEVSHTYAKAGKYYIKMTVKVYSETLLSKNLNSPVINGILGNALKDHCNTFVVEDSVYIKPTPVVNLPDSAFVCVIEGAKTLLDPKAQRTFDPTYRWITSETTPTIFADALGTYTVTVSNNYESRSGIVSCPVEDKTLVKEGCEPRLFAPEAFSPNGDSINDNFQIHSAHIEDFDLKIYNRWGEIIFESFDVDMRWDGKYKGKIMAPMMYAFVVSYKSKYFPYRPKITKTGGVMLIN
ncbi:PKD domain-containing protein [Emticicia soli]|uniref:PKD domain-containing protein n=1 Tax=Emticicia soli TaxID=2027878 RepID=A0ABW5JFB7_9BACT